MSVYPSAGQTVSLVFHIPQALQRKRITYMGLVRNCALNLLPIFSSTCACLPSSRFPAQFLTKPMYVILFKYITSEVLTSRHDCLYGQRTTYCKWFKRVYYGDFDCLKNT